VPHRPHRPRVTLPLLGGAAAIAGVMAAGFAIAAASGALGGEPITGQLLHEPPVRRSVDGVLHTTLTNAPAAVSIGGRRYMTGAAYEGLYPGPTLIVKPGDRLVVTQRNRLPTDSTNIHVHGLHVSPAPGHDNVFLRLRAGRDYVNTYDIPTDQYPGTYWYHPHWHMNVDYQTYDGMAGAIVVRGPVDDLPGIAGRRERTMVFQRLQLGDDGRVVPIEQLDETKAQTFINGQLRPVIDIRPGEVQRWRIINAQSDDFLRLAIDGQYFRLIGTDGTPMESPAPASIMLIPPGGRRTVLVRGGAPGDRALRTLEWGAGFQHVEPAVLATVRSGGPSPGQQALPGRLTSLPDLRRASVAARRTVEFSESANNDGPPAFLINGKTYDQWGASDMFRMKRGTVEEWTLTNTSNEWHPFHIHVNPFQIVAINGVAQTDVRYADVVPIPPGGNVTIRQRFSDFTGRFVIHCHILFHEDHGMMAPVRVVK